MKYFIFLPLLFILSCKKSSDLPPSESGVSQFVGKYRFSTKAKEVGTWAAMDFVFNFTEAKGGLNVNAIDDFVKVPDMGAAKVSGNSFTITQHVEANFDQGI